MRSPPGSTGSISLPSRSPTVFSKERIGRNGSPPRWPSASECRTQLSARPPATEHLTALSRSIACGWQGTRGRSVLLQGIDGSVPRSAAGIVQFDCAGVASTRRASASTRVMNVVVQLAANAMAPHFPPARNSQKLEGGRRLIRFKHPATNRALNRLRDGDHVEIRPQPDIPADRLAIHICSSIEKGSRSRSASTTPAPELSAKTHKMIDEPLPCRPTLGDRLWARQQITGASRSNSE